jgi:chromosome segregation ATPase
MLSVFEEFHNIMDKNIEIISQYSEIIQYMSQIFKLNILLKSKEQLSKELEITGRLKQSSDIKAITNLLQKLNESMEGNKKKLKYLEEDYFQRKNQYDQFTKEKDDFTSKIQELTKIKKGCFSQINKITREMSGNSVNQKEKLEGKVEIDNNLTNAQKIKSFQKKAKDAQIEIKELNSKLDEVNLRYEEFNPLFQTYKQDYNNLLEIIKSDTDKIEDLQSKLRKEIMASEKANYQNFEKIDLKAIRSKQEIEKAIKIMTSDLESISIPRNLIDTQNPEDLSLMIEKLNHINNTVSALEKDVRLNTGESELEEIFQSFQRLEIVVSDLERLINIFSSKINLTSHFQVLLSDDHKVFYIQSTFTRNNKEQITFDELTTPEKIFFIIIYYISIEIQLKNNNIIFSNLFIPSNYNKAGSIYRTIRKILPLFESDDFAEFNLIFILSNLEMKKEIKNLNVITIQENG